MSESPDRLSPLRNRPTAGFELGAPLPAGKRRADAGEGTRSPDGDPSRHRSKAQRPAVLPRAKKWAGEFIRDTTETPRPRQQHIDITAKQKVIPRDVAAVTRRRFPVGASPTRRPLQPEAAGAGMEATKCLKPSDNGHELVTARVCRPQRE